MAKWVLIFWVCRDNTIHSNVVEFDSEETAKKALIELAEANKLYNYSISGFCTEK